MTGNPKAWEAQLKAVPLTGTVSLLLRHECQVPPVGTQVSFTLEDGAFGLRADSKGEWQITHRDRVDHAGRTAIIIGITRVMVRGSGR